jgi:hypothetical protein
VSPNEEIRLVLTTDACPEQYDAFIGERQVGYLRLRHGRFSVRCPDVCGERIYEAFTQGDGAFLEDERELHLATAKAHIKAWVDRQGAQ